MSEQQNVTIHLMGGLGNQLFQIFTCLAYGYKEKRQTIFPYSDVLTTGITRNTYWESFLDGIKHLTTINNNEYTVSSLTNHFDTLQENGFRYQDIPEFNNKNIRLFGYFQSHKYFQKYYDDICSLMGLNYKLLQVRDKCSEYFQPNMRTISMHFRLGDYKQIQDCHPLMPIDYYRSSLYYMLSMKTIKKCNVLYFCQKQDYDEVSGIISKLSKEFNYVNFINVNTNISDWEEMLLMANCDDNVIANSTFSWWGAYFNQNPTKLVCYPKLWFGPKLKHNVVDLFPNKWQKIEW